MSESLLTALLAGGTIVTAGRRLARHLSAEYGAAQESAGRAAWESPDILPWEAWLERFWQESFGMLDGERPRALLSGAQELTLWESVIGSADTAPLLQVPAAARAAREAWQLLHAWQLPLQSAAEYSNDDANAFVRWAEAYARRLRRQGDLDSATLPDAVAQAVQQGRIRRPDVLGLAGFDEITPQQQAVIDALAGAGTRVQISAAPGRAARAARVACVDARDELRAAAAWARARLEAGARRVGIVVPDLSVRRAELAREFDEALAPQALLAGAEVVRPYSLSLGEPLNRVPAVQAALAVLEAGDERMPFALASMLIRSPFIAGHAEEAAPRAALDARLRQRGEESLSAHGLMRAARSAVATAPRLAAQLRAWRDALPSKNARLPPSGWSELFARLLAAIGWPGEATLDHQRVRALEAWRELLADLAAQDRLAPRLAYGSALALVRRMALERVFQPPGPATPVQVLGLLEAAGLEFDGLWVLGLDDHAWPASPRPNPFLPHALQRRHRMPHASAERELEFARQLTARLIGSADEVVFSHAEADGDEKRRCSPLLSELPVLRAEDLPRPYAELAAEQLAARALERLRDVEAPALPEGSRVAGGIGVLQQQAACPFRAFALYRLGARSPEQPEPGLDARIRGQLVHEVFRHLWQDLQVQDALRALSPGELDARVRGAVARALDRVAQERSDTLSERFRANEGERLASLVHECLALEKQRAPFRLQAAETGRTFALGGLRFDARLDRIDELADGRAVIMDYKTGKPGPKNWEGPRPDEPQLPAYALAVESERPVAALVFAQLRPGEVVFRGLAAEAGIVPGVGAGEGAESLSERLAQWRFTLAELAHSFRQGDARVDPKEFPATCGYCGLQALCRVNEQAIVPRERAEDGDE